MDAAFNGIVAIDGPSGSGKSTVSRRLATILDANYLDTGAMFRAMTAAVLRAQVDPTDPVAVAAVVEKTRLEITTDPAAPAVSIDGHSVEVEIRGPEVTAAVSAVAAVPTVRKLLLGQQRAIIDHACYELGRGIVVEGRDIGTVVAPDAVVKAYLTASEQTRAARRHAELPQHGAVNHSEVQQSLARRDALDSTRAVAPLTAAEDAVVVDTTSMSIDEVVNYLLALLQDSEH